MAVEVEVNGRIIKTYPREQNDQWSPENYQPSKQKHDVQSQFIIDNGEFVGPISFGPYQSDALTLWDANGREFLPPQNIHTGEWFESARTETEQVDQENFEPSLQLPFIGLLVEVDIASQVPNELVSSRD